ncbi:MAG: hypothetical protein HY851_04580, partial [candidate division Zixibacteria bacterium]|nr:hypothetical protein [candidate division Zixibacteria bacterium]
MYRSCYLTLMAGCMILVAATGTSFAQVAWLNPEGQPGVQIEASTGSFDKYRYSDVLGRRYTRDFDIPTSVIFASAR